MAYEDELVYWKDRLEQLRNALSKRSDTAHIDNYEQNGTKMDYTDMGELLDNLAKCECKVDYYQKKVDGKNTSILGKGVFIR
ncbi:hypothetical protein L3V83_12505 [Thiotrichales bacterium 19X7-9]|nr:hypothetical protein [Thiotrichales bacterium 19X7-9]